MSDKTNIDFSAILSKFKKDPKKDASQNSRSIIPLCIIILLSIFWMPINPITLCQDYPEFKTHAIVLSAFHSGIWTLALLFYFFSSKKSEIYKKYAVFACIAICIFNGYFWWNGTMIAPEEKGKIFIYNKTPMITMSDDQKYTYDLYISGESFFVPAVKSGSKITKISNITSVICNKFLITNIDGSRWEAFYRIEIDKQTISKLLTIGITDEESLLKALEIIPRYIELATRRNLREFYEAGLYKDEDGNDLTHALSIFEENNKPPEAPSLAKITDDREGEFKNLREDYAHLLTSDMINKIEKSSKESCQKEYKKKLKQWLIEKDQFFKQYVEDKEAFIDNWKKKEESMSDGAKRSREVYRVGYISYNLNLDGSSSPLQIEQQAHINLYRAE